MTVHRHFFITNRTLTLQVLLIVVLFAMVQLAALCSAFGQAAAARIMPLGDSITRGTNDINYPNGDIPGGYRKKLGELLAAGDFPHDFVGSAKDNAFPGMDPDHEGHNGYRTDEILTNLPGWLSAQPDSVLLHVGSNDILQGVSVETAAANLAKIVDLLVVSDPHRRLNVATIIPITQSWNGQSAAILNAKADDFNTRVRALVQQHAALGHHVALVDLNALLVYSDPDTSKNFFQPGDGIHPGQAGYDQMGTLWFNTIAANGAIQEPPISGTPVSPDNLAAIAVSGSRVNLVWTDMSDNETGFKIYRRTGSIGAWELIGTAAANATSFADTGLSTGTQSYYFAVASTNARTDSAWSDVAASLATNKALNKPASASTVFSTGFIAPNANNGDPALLWASASNDTAARWTVDLGTAYRIQQVRITTRLDVDQPSARKNFEIRASNDPTFATYAVLASQGNTSLPFASTWTASATNPNAYRYVRAAKTDGTFFNLSEVEVYAAVAGTVPNPPSNLAPSAIEATRISLSWRVNSSNEAGFKLERMIGTTGAFVEIASLPAAADSFVDRGLTAESTYSYRLRATSELGDSGYSNILSISTGSLTGYDTWAAGFPTFAALPYASQEPGADPNHDGVSNLLAYGLGIDPLADASSSLPSLSVGPFLIYKFRRNKLAPELRHQVSVSVDLSSGTWVPLGEENATVTPIDGDSGAEMISVPIPPTPGESSKFVRLEITR